MCRLLPHIPISRRDGRRGGARAAAFANGLKQRIEAAGLQPRIVITGELAIEDVQRWYQR